MLSPRINSLIPAVLVPVCGAPVFPVPSGKERKKTDNPREGWEDGTPPPHRDFKPCPVLCVRGRPSLSFFRLCFQSRDGGSRLFVAGF